MNESTVNFSWPSFSSYTAARLCQHSGNGVPFLLVAVPSVVWHTEQRRAIRDTWASVGHGKSWAGQLDLLDSARVIFVFGRSKTQAEESTLRAESAEFGDIVQAEFEDNYRNLSLKTLTILKWMTLYCPSATHLLKADEDTFVNIPLLLQLLATLTSRNSRYVLGFIYTSDPSKVQRHGKWALSSHLYPPLYYPYYAIGHSYVISGDCVKDLILAFRHFRLITIEDALFTGILSRVLNISRINCRLFASRLRKRKECSLIGGRYISETLCDAGRLRSIWRLLENGGCNESGLQEEQYRDLVSLWKPRGRRWQW